MLNLSVSEWVNVFLGILTVLGFGLTIYYGRQSAKSETKLQELHNEFLHLERQKHSIDFQDILACANELKNELSMSGFEPDIIFAPGLRGATFANVLEDEFRKDSLPVIVGISTWTNFDCFKDISGYKILTTKRWQLLIPNILFAICDKRLLIVDDFAMTGDFLSILKSELISTGYKEENIKSVTIATTTVAIENKTAPDFYWHEPADSNFFFPWGKAK
jgi:hypoxanthine phosphoribosyltransferase